MHRARIGILTLSVLAYLVWPADGRAQTNTGELRITATDPSGAAIKVPVQITSAANQFDTTLSTDASGQLNVKRLPFGTYTVEINQRGFAAFSTAVKIRSELPVDLPIRLSLSSVTAKVEVSANSTLLDSTAAGSVNRIGSATIENRLSSLPGRSLQDLVNSQPGWLYEGSAVLHPRGSEYQTQFVVDGIPLQDNRSPGFGPELEADDVESLTIYTAGIPAEYGRKLGGVVEVNTIRQVDPGFHGSLILSGGSYYTRGAAFDGQYAWHKNTLGMSAEGNGTEHYLNPVVVQNYTNRGTTGDFSVNYARDFTPSDRLAMSVRHAFARHEIPNENIQQQAGQLQTADNDETMGIVSYQHIFGAQAVGNIHAMVRDNANDFYSNNNSTPVAVEQHNRFREAYVKAALTIDRGHHEIKAGAESDATFLHENTDYQITDPSGCDSDDENGDVVRRGMPFGRLHPNDQDEDDGDDDSTRCVFAFRENRPDIEQSAYFQDLYHAGNWTINAGLRWDHYQLILNRHAVDPRFSISRYFPNAGVVVHFSYDRVFQTPSSENILLSSSTQVESIDPTNFLRLPVEPSEGNYFEVGASKAFKEHLRVDANYFRRLVNNFADDDQINDTTISFPIAFRKAIIYGAEGKIELEPWRNFSGYLSYSYEVGNVWNPVTGGLFLGDAADAAAADLSGHFPISQDQRNSLRGRLRYQITPRLWVAGGVQFDSGLPFEFQCDPSLTQEQCVANETAQYGAEVVNRIDFDRGRILPTLTVNGSLGTRLYKSGRLKLDLQADGENLTNVVDVVDFGGLFSGNAIGPARSFALRLTANF